MPDSHHSSSSSNRHRDRDRQRHRLGSHRSARNSAVFSEPGSNSSNRHSSGSNRSSRGGVANDIYGPSQHARHDSGYAGPAEEEQARVGGVMFSDSQGGESGLFYTHGNASRASSMRSGLGAGLYINNQPSRVSLNAGFTQTRSEYVFGDEDDASLYYAPVSNVGYVEEEEEEEEEDDGNGSDSTEGAGGEVALKGPRVVEIVEKEAREDGYGEGVKGEDLGPVRDAYELLCLPRERSADWRESEWEEEVRAAFRRLVPLLHPDGQTSPELSEIAESYFRDAVKAYESLVVPCKHAEYDADLSDLVVDDNDDGEVDEKLGNKASVDDIDGSSLGAVGTCEYHSARLLLNHHGVHTASDLAVRVDGRRIGLLETPRPLDLVLGHDVSFAVPTAGLRKSVRQAAETVERVILARLPAWLRKKSATSDKSRKNLRPSSPDPVLTVSGSLHTLLDHSPLALLSPLHHGLRKGMRPGHLAHLATKGIAPGLAIALQKEIPSADADKVSTFLSIEVSPLPVPSFSIHERYTIRIPRLNTEHPLYISGSSITTESLLSKPHVEIEFHQPVDTRYGGGAVWLAVDSGDWASDKNGRNYSFSSLRGIHFHGGPWRRAAEELLDLAVAVPPKFEIGWTGGPDKQPILPCQHLGALGRGREKECVAHVGKYQVSASWGGLTGPRASFRYRTGTARLFRSQAQPKPRKKPRTALELELSTSMFTGPITIARFLTRVGKFAHLGLELGSSARGSLQVGLHWQRLGQRASVPILISSGEHTGLFAKVVFAAAIIPPAITFAVKSFLHWRRSRSRALVRKGAREKEAEIEDIKRQIAVLEAQRMRRDFIRERSRVEADTLYALLSPGVEARQARERENKGLVIKSAKFGVISENGDGSFDGNWEVADVTVAVAGLVRSGMGESGAKGWLWIPGGLRKERLLGFWDPCPGRKKMLIVRYSFGGREATTMVGDKEEMRIPVGEDY